jgi:SAM-dependent methyltransferase
MPGFVGIYAVTVFSSAFLLFLVQPLFGRMVLPLLGGSPTVWNTCMVFFQAALLGGYLYAHLTTRHLTVRRQAALHLVFLAAAGVMLPLSIAGAAPPGGGAPIPWLLLLLLTSVGLPFLVLAGNGPILQRWFAESGYPGAADPYWLYAASNLGSLLALFAYPLLLEPRLRLAEQSLTWTLGYGALGVLVAGCAALVWRSAGAAPSPVGGEAREAAPVPGLGERAAWVALAFVPSSLLLGVTTYLTTDLTPVPLLWVLPLAIYLLSFILVFAERPPVPHRWMLAVQPVVLAAVTVLLLGTSLSRPALAIPVHLAGLWVTGMVCHGELARRRPAPARLTEFYLWIALGGVLGGVFNVLVAPLLFTHTWEYPLVLVLSCLARPWPRERLALRYGPRTALLASGVALLLIAALAGSPGGMPGPLALAGVVLVAALLTALLWGTPLWLAAVLGSVYLVRASAAHPQAETLHAERSFYGHYQVAAYRGRTARYHVLTHGSTMHGAQNRAPEERDDPLTYYLRFGPLGDVFGTMGITTRPRRVAVVGLGGGTTAAYAAEEEGWTFFELDPGIERIARDTTLFTYLADSPAPTRVVLGDARLSLAHEEREGAPGYDLILLDAFTSDAIPIHLLTREALEVYLSRLEPGGRIAFHISNRYLKLEPVVAALARERGLHARVGSWAIPRRTPYDVSSTWVVVTREEADLGMLAADRRWRPARVDRAVPVWTDDYSSILSVFSW